MSSQRIVGASTITSRIADGWTRFSALSKSLSSTDNVSSTSGGMVVFGKVELRHDPPDRLQRRLARQSREIGADEAVGAPREVVEIDVGGERHAAGVDAQDFAPAGLVGNADDDLAVEPAGAAKRLVDRFRAVGRGDDHRDSASARSRRAGSAAARPAASPPRR